MKRKRLIYFVLPVIFILSSFQISRAQKKKNTAVFVSTEFFHTTYDRTKFGNPGAFGFGAQAFFNRKSMFQPVAEVSVLHFVSDDVYRTDLNGHEIIQVSDMMTVMGGAAFVPFPYASLSIVAGVAILDNGLRFALKPTFALYFPKNERLSLRASIVNVFHRDKPTGQDFRGFNISLSVRIY